MREKITIALLGFWIASVAATLFAGFIENSAIDSYIVTALFASSAADISFARIKDSKDAPTNWILKGIAACVMLIAFFFQGYHASHDEDFGYPAPAYEEEIPGTHFQIALSCSNNYVLEMLVDYPRARPRSNSLQCS